MTPGGRFEGGRFAHSSRSAPTRDPRLAYAVNGMPPEVVLDFQSGVYQGASASGFDNLLAFSRPSGGTYVNASGVLAVAAVDEPRIDHRLQNGQWVSQGMMLEGEARTNMLLHSAEFSHASWSKSRASVLADDSIAPDGSVTASRLTSTASTYDGAVRQSASYTTGQNLSFSVFAKAGDRDFLFLRERSNGFAKDSYFDLRQGVPGTVNSIHTAEMQDMGNGWFRCSITVQATQSATTDFEIYNSEDNLNTASNQPGYVWIWGAQLEVGASVSSYIATQGTPVTRAPDVLALRATHVVDPVTSGAVSLAVEGDGDFVTETGAVRLLNWTDAAGDRITCQVATDAPGAGQVSLEQSVNGSLTSLTTSAGEVGPGLAVPFATATRHTGAETGLLAAGSTGVTGLPDLGLNAVELAPDLMGHLTRMRLWTADIGTAGMQEV
ncbi:hypothetical protein [Ruegeria sp.]|uniref:phage head spike fiber domain-containing protein n=1 Tax=Ruegeria sp. TaxID=1879320 RepID=UPI0023202820|nr:hypothetical protein [Ruegeria sp.]MDA7963537.1 hypothetical protein [Ruegeria sp.]